MKIKLDGQHLRLSFEAPPSGARVRLTDGARVLYEGAVSEDLSVHIDGEDWEIPEAVQQLLGQALPPIRAYSPDAFAPLATPYIGLMTLALESAGSLGKWSPPAVVRTQMLPVTVMAGVLHYAQSVFEGGKVYFRDRGGEGIEGRLFRFRLNARRMWRSAIRMGIALDESVVSGLRLDRAAFEELYLDLVQRTVKANAKAGLFDGAFKPVDPNDPNVNWTASPPALYVRPVLFATGPVLGVKPANHYTFAVYVTPAGKYRSDLLLKVEDRHPRAWPGGTGAAKAACNYAPTLQLMRELYAKKRTVTPDTPWMEVWDDLLFIDPEHNIEEMGGANFFVLRKDGDRLLLRTPPSMRERGDADTILPGVTRNTIIDLASLLGMDVEVERIPLRSCMDMDDHRARRTAVFTTGTAAGVAPVVALRHGEKVKRFGVWDAVDSPMRNRVLDADPSPPGSPLHGAKMLRGVLFALQFGDEARLLEWAGEHADAVVGRAKEQGWIQKFPVSR
jgi:branched-chain amino acid aminotransferase